MRDFAAAFLNDLLSFPFDVVEHSKNQSVPVQLMVSLVPFFLLVLIVAAFPFKAMYLWILMNYNSSGYCNYSIDLAA